MAGSGRRRQRRPRKLPQRRRRKAWTSSSRPCPEAYGTARPRFLIGSRWPVAVGEKSLHRPIPRVSAQVVRAFFRRSGCTSGQVAHCLGSGRASDQVALRTRLRVGSGCASDQVVHASEIRLHIAHRLGPGRASDRVAPRIRLRVGSGCASGQVARRIRSRVGCGCASEEEARRIRLRVGSGCASDQVARRIGLALPPPRGTTYSREQAFGQGQGGFRSNTSNEETK